MPFSRTLLLASLAFWLPGCAVFFPGHHLSEADDQEVVIIEAVEGQPTTLAVACPRAGFAGAGAVAAVAIEFAVERISEGLAREAERYEASWSGSQAGEFYETPEGDTSRLIGFLIDRKAANDKNVQVAAAELALSVQHATCGDAFRIQLDAIRIERAKAKVLHPSWRDGWWTRIPLVYGFFLYDLPKLWGGFPGDEAIDTKIDVTIDAVWLDKAGKGQKATLGSFQIELNDLKLGRCYHTANACPFDQKAETDQETESDKDKSTQISAQGTGWLPAVPRSVAPDGISGAGLGNYNLTIKVNESDDFKDTVSGLAKAVDENKKQITEHVVKFVGADTGGDETNQTENQDSLVTGPNSNETEGDAAPNPPAEGP